MRNLARRALASPARLVASRPVAFEHTLRDDTRLLATVFRLSATRLLAHHLTTVPAHPEPRSRASLWQTDGERSVLVGLSEGGAPAPSTADSRTPDPLCTGIDLRCVFNLARPGGGRSVFFYTLPDSCVGPVPRGGTCAGGRPDPPRRCCATFALPRERGAASCHNF